MEAKTVTLLSRLNRKDSATGADVWVKTILHDIPYKVKAIATASGTQTVMSNSYMLLVPNDDKYIPYYEWKNDTSKGYSINQGDYIVINEIISESVTPNNIQKIRQQYAPNVVEVKTIQSVEVKNGINYMLKIEGV